MFSKKHISFLIICLILALSLVGCRDREDYSSSPVIPGGEDMTHSNDSSDSTDSSDVSSTDSSQSSQTSSVSSSKPGKPTSSSTSSHLHSFKVTRIEPSCTKDGYTLYKCVECGETKIDSYVPKKGHSWSEWKTVNEATTTSTGLMERTCAVCGEKETETIAMLAPDYAAMQKELLNLVNDERTKNSIDKLECNSEVQKKADIRAEEIVNNFVTDTEQGDKYYEAIYKCDTVEGLAAKTIFEHWLSNNEYKNNILSDKYTQTAIGVKEKDGVYYLIQIIIG